MATELHLSQSPVSGMKRQIRALKSNTDDHRNLLHEVIESNMKTQMAVAEVSKSINDFVNTIRSVSDVPEDKSEKTAPRGSEIEEKLDRIAAQNLQLIQLISELVKHLKKGQPAPLEPPQPFGGTYPLRQLR